MTPERFDAACRALPGVAMETPWGGSQVYKVGGKMFAILGLGAGCSFKVSDIAYEALTLMGAARPAPYLARAKWVALSNLDDMDDETLTEHLQIAHGLIAARLTRAVRREIGLA